MYIKLRYKEPDGETSKLIEFPITEDQVEKPSKDFYFASSVAEFGMLLRESEYKGNSSYEQVIELARQNKGEDIEGYRMEFIKIVELAKALDNR